MNVKTQDIKSHDTASGTTQRSGLKHLPDICILLVMCILLFYGAAWQFFNKFSDVAKYQCYAVAFWQGLPALKSLPDPLSQCAFILHPKTQFPSNIDIALQMQEARFPDSLVRFVVGQSPMQSFHFLPHEYPFLTLIPFSFGLLVPMYWYQVAFAVLMAVVAIILYVVLLRYRSRGAALACALYLVTGGWATALGRFDLLPSALTLFALLCAVRTKWNRAFAWLALATLLKFYPAILLIPFLLAQQMFSRDRWYSWRRWQPAGVFAGVCVLVMGVSLLLSVDGTLGPFTYFGDRPIQAESFSASLLWLSNFLSNQQLHYTFMFGSLNVIGLFSPGISLLSTVLLAAGLLYTYWLQWRKRIDLATASLLTLLILVFTNKVFSPQYLIWVAPFVAYVGQAKRRWLLSWGLISALTTFIYPYIYYMTHNLLDVPLIPLFFPSTTLRNFLLLGFILYLLVSYSRKQTAKPSLPPVEDAPDLEHQQVAIAQRK